MTNSIEESKAEFGTGAKNLFSTSNEEMSE
jgi:hypothetical protein